jgi:hypothetical protein
LCARIRRAASLPPALPHLIACAHFIAPAPRAQGHHAQFLLRAPSETDCDDWLTALKRGLLESDANHESFAYLAARRRGEPAQPSASSYVSAILLQRPETAAASGALSHCASQGRRTLKDESAHGKRRSMTMLDASSAPGGLDSKAVLHRGALRVYNPAAHAVELGAGGEQRWRRAVIELELSAFQQHQLPPPLIKPGAAPLATPGGQSRLAFYDPAGNGDPFAFIDASALVDVISPSAAALRALGTPALLEDDAAVMTVSFLLLLAPAVDDLASRASGLPIIASLLTAPSALLTSAPVPPSSRPLSAVTHACRLLVDTPEEKQVWLNRLRLFMASRAAPPGTSPPALPAAPYVDVAPVPPSAAAAAAAASARRRPSVELRRS